ncbi:MAG: beta-ketoacyl synthase N-terminal-like domain-containing protein [Polyangiales bacterium]
MSERADDRIVVSAIAAVLPSPDQPFASQVDPTPHLLVRKSRKYLSPQDDLAVVAAANALQKANMTRGHLGERAALAMCVGYLSFDRKDTDPVLAVSVEDERFSMRRFSSEGMRKTHPLLTFRCLPNMPAFHVSVNFDLRGPYFCTYPTAAQTYAAIGRAMDWIEDGEADTVLVGAVAHQRNFLVEHHLGRLEHPAPREHLRDAGALIVLERASAAIARGVKPLATVERARLEYSPRRPYDAGAPVAREQWRADRAIEPRDERELGCASPLVALAERVEAGRAGPWEHTMTTRDGATVRARWEVLS